MLALTLSNKDDSILLHSEQSAAFCTYSNDKTLNDKTLSLLPKASSDLTICAPLENIEIFLNTSVNSKKFVRSFTSQGLILTDF